MATSYRPKKSLSEHALEAGSEPIRPPSSCRPWPTNRHSPLTP